MAELSGFEVLALLNEINSALQGAYINNIYSSGSSQLVRLRKKGTEDVWLVLSPKKGAWISTKVSERGETGPFTSRLRGELERAKFTRAQQVDLDRVFELEFEGKEPRRLILELMPPGNVIVTDGGGRIIAAEKEVRSEARRIAKGGAYVPPAQSRTSPSAVDAGAVSRMLSEEPTVGRAVGRHVALPRKYVAECLARLGANDGDPSSELEGREEEVVRVLRGMEAEARTNPRPCICETPRGDDIFVFPPRGARVKETSSSVSELCDALLLQEAQAEDVAPDASENKRKELEATIARLRSEAEVQSAAAVKLRAAADAARASPLEEAVGIMKSSGVSLAREPGSSAAAASALYDQAKRLEAKAEAGLESAEKLRRKIPKAEARAPKARPLARRKTEWYEKFRWFFTSEGKLAVGGRDAQSNSGLLGRHLEPRDTVYHADLFGSPFFVLKGGADQSEAEVRQISVATVAFSSAWKTGLGSADAYWVLPEQVSSAAPSGEYLPRGSFAIRGKKNFVNKNMVEIAVGVDPEGRIVSGPEEAIRKSARYLVLRPQREKSSDTAKKVLKELEAVAGKTFPPAALDEVLRALPSGGGKIVRRGGGAEV